MHFYLSPTLQIRTAVASQLSLLLDQTSLSPETRSLIRAARDATVDAVLPELRRLPAQSSIAPLEVLVDVFEPFVPSTTHAFELANNLLFVLNGHHPRALIAEFLQTRRGGGNLDLTDDQLVRLSDLLERAWTERSSRR